MRKLLSFILLFCLVLYMGGYHLVYALYRQELKNEMRAWLSVHDNEPIGDNFYFSLNGKNITDDAFTWEEHDHEFSYHGELYDVVTIHYTENGVTIHALKDGRENELAKQLAGLDHTKQEKNSHKALLKFFPVCILPLLTEEAPAERALSLYNRTITPAAVFLPASILTPPPRA